METGKKRPEFAVGLFVLLGFGLIAWLTLRFELPGSGGKAGYPVYVSVADATGVRAGVPVRVGGVEIGRVASDPQLSEDFSRLRLELTIFKDRKIPKNSTISVATSGLMGDSFIKVTPPAEPVGEFVDPGDTVSAGGGTGSIGDLAGEAGVALREARTTITEVRGLVADMDRLFLRIEEGVLTDENLENLKVVLAELRKSSEDIGRVSGEVGPLLAKADRALDEFADSNEHANRTFDRIDTTMTQLGDTVEKINPIADELDQTFDELRVTLDKADGLLYQVEHGDGLASALVKNSNLRTDLESFIDKLDRNGVLFYPREGGLLNRESSDRDSSGGSERRDDKKEPFSWLKKKR